MMNGLDMGTIGRITAAVTLATLALGCTGAGDGDRSLRAGIERMEELAADGEYDAALDVVARLLEPDLPSRMRTAIDGWTAGASEGLLEPVSAALDAVGIDTLTERDRDELEYARALTNLLRVTDPTREPDDGGPTLDDVRRKLEDLRSAGGPVSLAAVRVLGDVELAAAEAVRATIPEIAGQDPNMPPPPPAPSAKDEKDDADPLDTARQLYLGARKRYVERLVLHPRIDGADDATDARANAELVTRRLRELDELEEQREQQQQDQQDQQQSSDDSSEEGDPKDQEPQDGEESEPKDGEDETDRDPSEEQPSEDEQESDPTEDEAQDEESPEDAESEEEPADEDEGEPEEQPRVTENELTAEEQQRLMERNREYQEQGDEKARAIRRLRRIPAKRDW